MDFAETLERVNKKYPEHDRTSCDDEDLYNGDTPIYPYRCDRCRALQCLKWMVQESELAKVDPTNKFLKKTWLKEEELSR